MKRIAPGFKTGYNPLRPRLLPFGLLLCGTNRWWFRKKGAIKHLFQRWLFRFKDANNAWRFARLVDGNDFPGYPDTPLRATVID